MQGTMFFTVLVLFSSQLVINAQYFGQQGQLSNNIYSQWLSNSPWNQQIQQGQQGSVRGFIVSEDSSQLPFASQITVTLADVTMQDVASRPLNSIVLSGAYRFPIPFEITYSVSQLQAEGYIGRMFVLQARIERDGQLLYSNDQHISVQLVPPPMLPINIPVRRINTPSLQVSVNGFTTRAPLFPGIHICLQKPDIGPCKAIIPQFYFNSQTRTCEVFYWGGCGGTENRFNTREQCERGCSSYRPSSVFLVRKQKFLI